MNAAELTALVEPYLDSKGYKHGTSQRTNSKSYLTQLLKFMTTTGCEELSNEVITAYIRSKEGTSQLGVRQLRIEEFLEYTKGERQLSMIGDTETTDGVIEPEPVKEASSGTNDTGMQHMTGDDDEPETAHDKDTGTDMVKAQESSGMCTSEYPSTTVYEPVKSKGRPKKAVSEQRKNSFSVYLTDERAQALRDLADYERKETSVFLGEIIEKFIKRNEKALSHYRTFLKDRIQLE